MLTEYHEPLSKIESKHREQFNPNVSRVLALQCAVAFKPFVVLFLALIGETKLIQGNYLV